MFAGDLIEEGAIGRVLQVTGFGPHRLNAPSRPNWFFNKEQYGGILCDIGSHQIEQFLYYAGCKNADILHSKVANYDNPNHPELEDYGDATLVGDNGAMVVHLLQEQKEQLKFVNMLMWLVIKQAIIYIW